MSTLPTVNVTVNIIDAGGIPVPGALIVFRLNRSAAVGGVIVPINVTATTGADGQAVVPLCPNALCGGAYSVRISVDGVPDTRGVAVVPNRDCLLDEIFQSVPYPGQDYIEAAISILTSVNSQIDAHIADNENPHDVIASQVGLGNVTNDAQVKRVEMGMPGGTPTLDVDARVVQDPASASTTPAPGAIPKAGLSGLLDAWISAASTAVAGLVQLATNAVAWAGTSTSQVITAAALWYVLSLATRLRISSDTTIYVSPTGNDSTGTGAVGSPYASIYRALLSIAGKSIDDGFMVTIQCADGTFNISSSVVFSHDNSDRIKILGNTSAETTVPIVSIDTTAKTITVAGNYVSNSDATKNIQNGDDIDVINSSTSGINGVYTATAVSYNGTNTVVTCSGDTFVSSTVGGASLVVKPCNRCIISGSSGLICFNITKNLSLVSGFRFNVSGAGSKAVLLDNAKCTVGTKIICHGAETGVQASNESYGFVQGISFKGCALPLAAYYSTLASNTQKMIFHGVTTRCVTAMFDSFVYLATSAVIMNSYAADYSPAANTTGYNGNSYIQVS